MSKKILLVNPWIYDFTAFDLWLKPLGLLYLASHLLNQGYEVELLDCLNRLDPSFHLSLVVLAICEKQAAVAIIKKFFQSPLFFRMSLATGKVWLAFR